MLVKFKYVSVDKKDKRLKLLFRSAEKQRVKPILSINHIGIESRETCFIWGSTGLLRAELVLSHFTIALEFHSERIITPNNPTYLIYSSSGVM